MIRNALILTLVALVCGVAFSAYMLVGYGYEYEVVSTGQSAGGDEVQTVTRAGTITGIDYMRATDTYSVAAWAAAVVIGPALAVMAARKERTFVVWWVAITLLILGLMLSGGPLAIGFGVLSAMLLTAAFLLQRAHKVAAVSAS
jgi:hypothetical protein